MMNYEEFKQKVEEEFLNYMPEEYQDYEVLIHKTKKINCELDGLTLRKPEMNAAPTVYINHMYEHYKEIGVFEIVLRDVANAITKALEDMPEMLKDTKCLLEKLDKKNIFFQLINTNQNKNYLDKVPHREYLDLSIVYKCKVADKTTEGSAGINNDMARIMGLNEEQLFALAMENTKRMFPPVVNSMEDTMEEIKSLLSEEEKEELDEFLTEEHSNLIVISNNRTMFGAASVLYEETLQQAAELLDGNLFVIPSSIHEMIVLSAEENDMDYVAKMVLEINREHVNVSERLSNNIYFYSRSSNTLSLVTDVPETLC